MAPTKWVTWGRARVAHAVPSYASRGWRNGDFPLLCGVRAPDGWDQELYLDYHKRHCQRCEKELR